MSRCSVTKFTGVFSVFVPKCQADRFSESSLYGAKVLKNRPLSICPRFSTVARLIAFVLLTVISKHSIADDTPSFNLQTSRWAQLVVPANAANLSVREMFADDLPATDYGSSWIIFWFDVESNSYVDPGIDGTLAQGVGFWMVQVTGSNVTLDLPGSVSHAVTSASAACPADSCAEVAVYSRSNQSTYNMIGTALASNVSVEQSRLTTNDAPLNCESGCSLSAAADFQYISDSLWSYDSSGGRYVNLAESGQIAPWQGFWLSTQAAMAGATGSVLFAMRSVTQDVEAEDAARLLAQASFGPNMESINAVRRLGIAGWVDDQLTRDGGSHLIHSETYYPDGGSRSGPRQHKWLLDAIEGQDQLRSRVAFAYSEIFVVSDLPENLTKSQFGMTNYYDILREEAFGNFRDLLERVTLSPIMGVYLSMLQNARGDPELNTRADENFAREVMQLFTLGLHELNLDGTTRNDAAGNPIPAYSQADIEEYARVYTGWDWHNVDSWGRIPLDSLANKFDPMTPNAAYHDDGQKNLLNGVVSPAGLSATADLDIALDSLFNHPNVGPFIGKQLIQRLVTSNPTPAYVARVASVFNNNGEGVRGDMGAVIRAILLDIEARDGYASVPNFGKLREPLMRWTHLWRAFNVQRGNESLPHEFNHIAPYIEEAGRIFGQSVLSAPSVFNFFHPDYAPLGGNLHRGILFNKFK